MTMVPVTRTDGSIIELNSAHITEIKVADPDEWAIGSKSVITTLDGKLHAVQETIDQLNELLKGTA